MIYVCKDTLADVEMELGGEYGYRQDHAEKTVDRQGRRSGVDGELA